MDKLGFFQSLAVALLLYVAVMAMYCLPLRRGSAANGPPRQPFEMGLVTSRK